MAKKVNKKKKVNVNKICFYNDYIEYLYNDIKRLNIIKNKKDLKAVICEAFYTLETIVMESHKSVTIPLFGKFKYKAPVTKNSYNMKTGKINKITIKGRMKFEQSKSVIKSFN